MQKLKHRRIYRRYSNSAEYLVGRGDKKVKLQKVRGRYDYNMVMINSDLNQEEILSVIVHELGHEYLTLHTSLGQMGWLMNNLANNDPSFKKSYEGFFEKIDSIQEQYCLLIEVCSRIALNDYKDKEKIVYEYEEKFLKVLGKFKKWFCFYIENLNKANYNETVNFFSSLFILACAYDLPDISYDQLKDAKKLVTWFDKSNIRPKKKLKRILKDLTTLDNPSFQEMKGFLAKKYDVGNALPSKIGSIRIDTANETVIIDYESKSNELIRKYKSKKNVNKLFEDVLFSSLLSGLLNTLSNEIELIKNSDPFERILQFSEMNVVSGFREIDSEKELIEILSYSDQITLLTPYNDNLLDYEDDSYFDAINKKFTGFKVLIRKIDVDKNTYKKAGDFKYDFIKNDDLITRSNKSKYLFQEINILCRLNYTNNQNIRFFNRIRNNIKNENWINIFVCNPASQLIGVLSKIKEQYGENAFRYRYGDVKVFELDDQKIRLYFFLEVLDWKNITFDKGKPSQEMNVLVSSVLELVYNGDIIFNYLDDKRNNIS